MKKLLCLTFLCLAPFSARAEVIHSFVSDITLSQSGSFVVDETIDYDFEKEDRHGIFRTIPLSSPPGTDRLWHERYIDINVNNVEMDGAPVAFEFTTNNKGLEIKIGDADHTITGEHTYHIVYTVNGALTYYENGGADLYWNVTGNEWPVSIEKAEARLSNQSLYLNDGTCYIGGAGATDTCEIATSSTGVSYQAQDLAPGEGLTIARAIDPNKVEKVVLDRLNFTPFWLLGAVLWLVGLLWTLCQRNLANRTGHTIVAQYEPLPDVKPMYSGVLFDGRIDPRDVTAGLVSLAEQGFLKITRVEKSRLLIFKHADYEITLRRSFSEVTGGFDRTLLELLFPGEATVGDKVSLDDLAADKSKQRQNYHSMQELRKTVSADLLNKGYFESATGRPAKILVGLLFALGALLLANWFAGAEMAAPFVIATVTFSISLVLVLVFHRRRTKKGYEALDYLKGFKLFLSVTDKERFAFRNAPEKSPKQFMEYLPYAIAFGVEKEWAKVFEDITIPEPDWYEGRGSAFNAVLLSNNLGSFSTAFAQSSGTAPASTGGGSAGGGAGGGGGGSW